MISNYEKYNMKEYQRLWRDRNRDKVNNYHRVWRDKNRDSYNQYHKIYWKNYYNNNILEARNRRKIYMRTYRLRKKNNLVYVKKEIVKKEIVIEKKIEPKLFNKEYRNIVLTF